MGYSFSISSKIFLYAPSHRIVCTTTFVNPDKWVEERNEGNVLFNDALNTFYLQLYGIRHMAKDCLDSLRGRKEGKKYFI